MQRREGAMKERGGARQRCKCALTAHSLLTTRSLALTLPPCPSSVNMTNLVDVCERDLSQADEGAAAAAGAVGGTI